MVHDRTSSASFSSIINGIINLPEKNQPNTQLLFIRRGDDSTLVFRVFGVELQLDKRPHLVQTVELERARKACQRATR
jgi:hypothetical protein